jgi:hypothetical protein
MCRAWLAVPSNRIDKRFADIRREKESGLYWTQFRRYNPAQTRWLSPARSQAKPYGGRGKRLRNGLRLDRLNLCVEDQPDGELQVLGGPAHREHRPAGG